MQQRLTKTYYCTGNVNRLRFIAVMSSWCLTWIEFVSNKYCYVSLAKYINHVKVGMVLQILFGRYVFVHIDLRLWVLWRMFVFRGTRRLNRVWTGNGLEMSAAVSNGASFLSMELNIVLLDLRRRFVICSHKFFSGAYLGLMFWAIISW